MDHSWGRNVFDKGLSDLGATLAARWHAPIPTDVVYVLNVPGFFIWGVFIPPDTVTPWLIFNMGTNPAGLRFPYGRTVDPDVPL